MSSVDLFMILLLFYSRSASFLCYSFHLLNTGKLRSVELCLRFAEPLNDIKVKVKRAERRLEIKWSVQEIWSTMSNVTASLLHDMTVTIIIKMILELYRTFEPVFLFVSFVSNDI